MCEQIANVDLKCPVEKGKITITKDVDIPKEIPGVSIAAQVVFWMLIIDRELTPLSLMLILLMRRRSFVWKLPLSFRWEG
jgi:hypothetical protein